MKKESLSPCTYLLFANEFCTWRVGQSADAVELAPCRGGGKGREGARPHHKNPVRNEGTSKPIVKVITQGDMPTVSAFAFRLPMACHHCKACPHTMWRWFPFLFFQFLPSHISLAKPVMIPPHPHLADWCKWLQKAKSCLLIKELIWLQKEKTVAHGLKRKKEKKKKRKE